MATVTAVSVVKDGTKPLDPLSDFQNLLTAVTWRPELFRLVQRHRDDEQLVLMRAFLSEVATMKTSPDPAAALGRLFERLNALRVANHEAQERHRILLGAYAKIDHYMRVLAHTHGDVVLPRLTEEIARLRGDVNARQEQIQELEELASRANRKEEEIAEPIGQLGSRTADDIDAKLATRKVDREDDLWAWSGLSDDVPAKSGRRIEVEIDRRVEAAIAALREERAGGDAQHGASPAQPSRRTEVESAVPVDVESSRSDPGSQGSQQSAHEQTDAGPAGLEDTSRSTSGNQAGAASQSHKPRKTNKHA